MNRGPSDGSQTESIKDSLRCGFPTLPRSHQKPQAEARMRYVPAWTGENWSEVEKVRSYGPEK